MNPSLKAIAKNCQVYSRFFVPFTFEGAAVRVVTREGEPWFVAKDAAEILGYSNASQAVSQHCKGVAIQYPFKRTAACSTSA